MRWTVYARSAAARAVSSSIGTAFDMPPPVDSPRLTVAPPAPSPHPGPALTTKN